MDSRSSPDLRPCQVCAQQAESVNLTAGLQGLAWHTGFLEQAEAYEPGTQGPGAG